MASAPIQQLPSVDPPQSHSELLAMIKAGSPDAAEALRLTPEPWRVRDLHGETPLHWAAANGDVALIELAVSLGVSPFVHNYRGTEPLYYAATRDAGAACSALLRWADPRRTSGFSGVAPDGAAKAPELRGALLAARLAVDGAEASPHLRLLYRMCRWGQDTLNFKLQALSPGRFAVEWGGQWRERGDLLPLSVPEAHSVLLAEWPRFLGVLSGSGPCEKTCAGCGRTGVMRRCGRCRAVRFCGSECQRTAWPLHRLLGCGPEQK